MCTALAMARRYRFCSENTTLFLKSRGGAIFSGHSVQATLLPTINCSRYRECDLILTMPLWYTSFPRKVV